MNDILTGWKEISQYMKVSYRTAIRYKNEKGLPVQINKAGHPVIKKETVDVWFISAHTS
jgi:predicted site-specific integrase-resolvase